MSASASIEQFLSRDSFAVVGASRDRGKYGNMVLRTFLQNGRTVFPVNPHADQVEGLPSYPNLAALPRQVDAISIITPPHITEHVIEQAADLGIHNVWMQPGAESAAAIQKAEDAGMNVIAGGPCLLVVLGFRDSW